MDFVQHASEYTLFSTGVGEAEGDPGKGIASLPAAFFDTIFTGTLDIAFEASIFWRHWPFPCFVLCVWGCETCSKRSQLQHWSADSPGRLVVALAKGIEGLR